MHLLALRYSFEPGFHQRRGPYVLAHMKQIYRKTEKIVLIKNKNKTLGTATRVLSMACSSVQFLFSTYISHPHLRGRDHAMCPNSMMGTTSADYPLAARSGQALRGPHGEGSPARPPALAASLTARIHWEHWDLGIPECRVVVPGDRMLPGDEWLTRGPSW